MKADKLDPILQSVGYFAQVLDVLGAGVLYYFVYWLYLDKFDLPQDYLSGLVFSTFLILFIFQSLGLYTSWRGKSKFHRFRLTLTAWLLVNFFLILITVLLKTTAVYSRVWFFSWSLSTLVFLNGYRILIDFFLSHARKKGWNTKGIAIVGTGELGKLIAGRLKKAEWVGFQIESFFEYGVLGQDFFCDHPMRPVSELSRFVREKQIKEIWIALPFKEEEKVKSLLHDLRHIPISIKLIPDIFGFRLLNQEVHEVAGIPILQLNGTPIQGVNRLLKEIEDRLLSLIILIIISPVLLVVAIMIKIESKGPILFKQIRNGWDGKEIKVYKFRSMRVDAEKDGFIQASKNDKRVTKVGAFIRKTSLDELPQFFNVLQGRMSIVGPRPHVVSQNEEYKDQVDYYMQRHRVKPGITGWAQVNGLRGETDTLEKMSKRVEYDLYYIENWSLLFDLRIILMTIFKGFVNKNAY